MLKVDSTVTTLVIAGIAAGAVGYLVNWASEGRHLEAASANPVAAANAESPPAHAMWAASATGRVEPKDGEARITAQSAGKIAYVPIKMSDRAVAGDLLLQLDDEDYVAKISAAEAEADVRRREREEEAVKGPALDRRKAEDALETAERALHRSRFVFDEALAKYRNAGGNADEVTRARQEVAAAVAKVEAERANLTKMSARADMPLPTRLESSLTQARSDLSLAYAAFERTRVRAPFDGTVLNVAAKSGELAAPSPDAPLVTFGDLSGLRVRAEVEERDVAKVHAGQRVVVRSDAFPERDFEGSVTSISPALGSARIATRGPRRPNDVDVLEVLIALDGTPPLLTGLRVDVFFKLDKTAQAKTN